MFVAFVWGVVGVSSANEESLTERFLDNLKKNIVSENLAVWKTEHDYTFRFSMGTVSFEGGQIGNLSSLEFVGDRQQVIQKYPEQDNYFYDLTIGFKQLLLETRYRLDIMFWSYTGRVFVEVKQEAFRNKGTYIKSDDGKCLYLPTTKIENLGELDIRIRSDNDGDVAPIIVGNLLEIVLNRLNAYFMTSIKPVVNEFLKTILKTDEFTSVVCNSFQF